MLSFLESVAHELLTQQNAEAGINMLLEKMLEYFDGVRCYVFEFDKKHTVTSNTYEVCADGITPQKDNLQKLPMTIISYWLRAFKTDNYISIENVGALNDDRPDKNALLAQNIRSLVAVPLRNGGNLVGFIGIDNPRQKQNQIISLTSLGDYAVVLLTRRDMIEEIYTENQEKLAVMDGIPGGFVRMQIRPDDTIFPLYFSEGMKKLLNMNRQELISLYGNNVMAGVHPDDLDIATKAFARLIRHGEGLNMRYRLAKGGGGYVWVSIFGKVITSRSGDRFMNVYYTDATEQKKNEDLQAELLDNLPCGAALYELIEYKLKVIYLNKNYWEIVGRAPRNIEDIDVMAAIYPDDRHIVTDEIIASIRQKRDFSCNLRILYGDSSYRMFNVAGRYVRLRDGTITLCVTYTPLAIDAVRAQTVVPVILSAIMESTSELSFVKTADFRYICVSNAFVRLTGLANAQEIIGKTDYDIFDKVSADKYRADDLVLLKTGESIIDMVEPIPFEGNNNHIYRTSKYLVNDTSGAPIAIYGTGRDVTDEQSITEKLRISEEEYKLALEHTGCSVCRFLIPERTLMPSPEMIEKTALPERIENVPASILKLGLISKESERAYLGFYRKIIRGQKNGSVIFQCRTKNGPLWIEERFSTVFSDGIPVSAVLSYSDVTERQEKELIYKKWQQSLQEKKQNEYTLFRCNISRDSFADTHEGGLLRASFDEATQTFNDRTATYAKQYVAEQDRDDYISLVNSDLLLASYYRGTRYRTLEYREMQSDGSARWLKLTIELVEYPNSFDIEAYLMYENIDDAKKAELQIKANAETDPLTGVLNRASFSQKMESLITAHQIGRLCALLMLDLDNFKLINDRYGHMAGDRALIEVGKRIRETLRPNDLTGRLGGDEFVVFISDINSRSIISEITKRLFESLTTPYKDGVCLAASVGISVCPDDGMSFEPLYKKADAALYYSKKAGKNNYAFYDDSMGTEKTHT